MCIFVCAGLHACILCGAPTVQTWLTTPPINTVRHASPNRLVFNHSCHRHVYGNTRVYVTNAFLIAQCICSIFLQIISDEPPPDWGSVLHNVTEPNSERPCLSNHGTMLSLYCEIPVASCSWSEEFETGFNRFRETILQHVSEVIFPLALQNIKKTQWCVCN